MWTLCFNARTFAFKCLKVHEMLMGKDACGESLLWTVARRGRVDDFMALLTCLKDLAGEYVGNNLTSLFKAFVTDPCVLSVMVLTRD